MELTRFLAIDGTIELLTGLHIGSGDAEMHIGGTDSPVVKNPLTQEPYIPGSSIKGKMRSLLEWRRGLVSFGKGKPFGYKEYEDYKKKKALTEPDKGEDILKLFGAAPDGGATPTDVGPSRLSFWDCSLNKDWVEKNIDARNLLLTEVKMENSIDRIKGTGLDPRNTERVPAGAIFDFKLTVRVHDNEALLDTVFEGLKLVQLGGLGGSGSRGYGKVKFSLADSDMQKRFEDISLD